MDKKWLVLILIGAYIGVVILLRNGHVEEAVTIMIISGFFGVLQIAEKGYLTITSLVLFLFLGWWALLILMGFGGPLLLVYSALLPERKRCFYCQEWVKGEAIRCSHCQGDLQAAT